MTVSCQVSDLVFEWRLEEEPGGGTRIAVHVEIPEAEAHRLDGQRAAVPGRSCASPTSRAPGPRR